MNISENFRQAPWHAQCMTSCAVVVLIVWALLMLLFIGIFIGIFLLFGFIELFFNEIPEVSPLPDGAELSRFGGYGGDCCYRGEYYHISSTVEALYIFYEDQGADCVYDDDPYPRMRDLVMTCEGVNENGHDYKVYIGGKSIRGQPSNHWIQITIAWDPKYVWRIFGEPIYIW